MGLRQFKNGGLPSPQKTSFHHPAYTGQKTPMIPRTPPAEMNRIRDGLCVRAIVSNVQLRKEVEDLRRQLRDEQWFKVALKLIVLPAETEFSDEQLFREVFKKCGDK